MSPVRITLLDVSSEYTAALTRAARRSEVLITSLAGDPGARQRFEGPLACLLQASGDESCSLDRLRSVQKALAGAPLVVLAERVSTDHVVRILRAGVADVIGIPAPADAVAARVLELVSSRDVSHELLGHSPELARVRGEIAAVATSEATVLLTGETGTGKGLAARMIHELSSRRDGPFVHVDCASLSPGVFESELFGHERGAFTGAASRRLGRFEVAAQGTIFLDEVGDLDQVRQAKLLRVLQDLRFERVGGSATLRMTARVVAATNRDLHAAVIGGSFRPDLYFRLNVVRLHMPPLRVRPEDIPVLARSALGRIAERNGFAVPIPSDGFLRLLTRQRWPGNVRELINALERVLVRRGGGVLEAEHLDGVLEAMPLDRAREGRVSSQLAEPDLGDRERIADALLQAGGNVSRAARRLGMTRERVRYRIRKYGLSDLVPRD